MTTIINKKENKPRCIINGIPLCVPEIRGNEWKYIKECLDTNWISSAGAYVDRFESVVKAYIGTDYAVACASGTAALHTSLLAAEINSDEEVLVPDLTFIATANVLRYIGAWPVFMDVCPDTFGIDPQKINDFLAGECEYSQGRLINRHTKRTVRAIIPVHLLGHPVDMDPLLDIAKRFNLIVIEDAAQSLGAAYKGQKVASLGDIACLSFNGNKIITAGAGGMILTNNRRWAERARYLSTQARDDVVELIHNEVGYNYRLSNINAAMGTAQMELLDEYVDIKRLIAKRYNEGLAGITGISLPVWAKWAKSTFWLYTILVDEQKFGLSNRELLKILAGLHIESRPLWCPLHLLKPFKGCYAYNIKEAINLYAKGLNLPSSVGLKKYEQEKVITAIAASAAKGRSSGKKPNAQK